VPKLYRDPQQPATAHPAALPAELTEFARQAVASALKDPLALACVLGEYLTEPKPSVWFDEPGQDSTRAPYFGAASGLVLDARTRMMYDEHHIFINGESYRAKGADALLMRQLADQRHLNAAELSKASASAQNLLTDWQDAGWLEMGRRERN
jgi:50S ribosomal protein L16 3-hydroxylase